MKNYRSLADLTVELSPLNILVGANSSGKSNFVDVLRFVADALQLGLFLAVAKRSGIGSIQRWLKGQRQFNVMISLHLNVNDLESEYTFTLGSSPREEHLVYHEQYISGNSVIFERTGDEWLSTPSGLSPTIQERGLMLPLLAGLPDIAPVYDFLTNMNFYYIFPNVVRYEESQTPGNPYPLDEYGTNFRSALREFLRASNRKSDFENSLGRILPDFNGFAFLESVDRRFSTIYLVHKDGNTFELGQESDGTLRILALLLALYQDPPRTLIAIEEPGILVHPGALGVLCDVIKEASERSQIIITTHSPDIVAQFDINDLRVVELTDEGTKIGPVDEVQRKVIEEQLFKASDLLRIDGELRRASTDI